MIGVLGVRELAEVPPVRPYRAGFPDFIHKRNEKLLLRFWHLEDFFVHLSFPEHLVYTLNVSQMKHSVNQSVQAMWVALHAPIPIL